MRVLSSTSSEYLSLKSNDYATKQLIFVRQIFVVFLSFSTSNHNLIFVRQIFVVFLSFSTSNHNYWHAACIVFSLYIFHFLHQTTTFASSFSSVSCCISFIFYIKPQQQSVRCSTFVCCISFIFYIKPQLCYANLLLRRVVYLSFSTSNHNLLNASGLANQLYIFHFLHQTTTMATICAQLISLYIFHFLHQTTTLSRLRIKFFLLYIFHFLHQTTTLSYIVPARRCCISFIFYIKPQLLLDGRRATDSCISFIFYIKPQLCSRSCI